MITDKILETIITQAPSVGILLVFTITLYRDMRNDAKEATKQRQESIEAINKLTESIDRLLETLRVARE